MASQKLPDICQILQGLPGIAATAFQVLLERRCVYALIHPHVELGTDPDQHEAAHEFKQPINKYAPTIISVSINRVVSLRLANTRS